SEPSRTNNDLIAGRCSHRAVRAYQGRSKMFRAEVRRAGRVSSAGVSPARQLSFWPVVIEGVAEVTKLPEPSVERVAMGDLRVRGP
ncbi:MAG TPA: hypothetical protein VKU02_19240, partial [Gemmataceae bacterium]|nr:hypothetical protein [Gemmataceae bacterium]